MIELEVPVGRRSVLVRDAGDPQGRPVVHFHGTPGSRLEVDFGAALAERTGVRLITFDRPGYGGSGAAPTSLGLVAGDVAAVVDHLGVDRFAAMGWSGGGPFALAAAAAMPDRVTRVGVSGGPAPVDQVPGGRDTLTPDDRRALAFLPDEPTHAAEEFLAGNRDLLDAMVSVRDDEQAPWIDWMWAESDPDVVADQTLRRALHLSFREALRQGPMGIAWDNVAFVGPWGFDLAEVACPVHLWHGEQDRMVPASQGVWLAEQLVDAELVLYPEEGHLLPLRHWAEMLRALRGVTATSPAT